MFMSLIRCVTLSTDAAAAPEAAVAARGAAAPGGAAPAGLGTAPVGAAVGLGAPLGGAAL
jgi:hypothetical protein